MNPQQHYAIHNPVIGDDPQPYTVQVKANDDGSLVAEVGVFIERTMTFNHAEPVWHAVVLCNLRGKRVDSRDVRLLCRDLAVQALLGVGHVGEWWWWDISRGVGHLRVPMTPDEQLTLGYMPASVISVGVGTMRSKRSAPRKSVDSN